MKTKLYYWMMSFICILFAVLLTSCGGNTESNPEIDSIDDAFAGFSDSIDEVNLPEVESSDPIEDDSLSDAFSDFSESVGDVELSEIESIEPAGIKRSDIIDEYFGTINDGTYTNDILGIGCQLSDDWVYYSEEEIMELNQTTAEILSNYDITANPDDLDTFNITDMVASSIDNMSKINVVITHLSAAEAYVLTEELLASYTLEQLLPIFEDMGYSNCVGETEIINFIGGEHSAIHIEGSIDGSMFYQTEMFIMEGHNYGAITVSSLNEDITDDILECFFKNS